MIANLFGMMPAGQGGGAPGGGGSMITMLIPWILILLFMYLLILRPQAKRQKEHQKMLESITRGDRVVTTAGIHGVVQRINEKEGTIVVQVSDETRMTFDRAAVAHKVESEESLS